jgi:hypothetical protein
MTGTHGRDRPVLADDGGVGVYGRPLRLEKHKSKGVLLDPPPLLHRGGLKGIFSRLEVKG